MKSAALMCLGAAIACGVVALSMAHKGKVRGDVFAMPAVLWAVWCLQECKRLPGVLLASAVIGTFSIAAGLLVATAEARLEWMVYVAAFAVGAATAGIAIMFRAVWSVRRGG